VAAAILDRVQNAWAVCSAAGLTVRMIPVAGFEAAWVGCTVDALATPVTPAVAPASTNAVVTTRTP
jgi:hypothetical protein